MSDFQYKTPMFLESGRMIHDILIENMNLDPEFLRKHEAQSLVENADAARDRIEHKGRFIERFVFTPVYADFRNYPEREDVLQAIGFKLDDFGATPSQRQQNMAKSMQRIIARFNDSATDPSEVFPSFQDRKRHYVNLARKAQGDFDDDDFDAPKPTLRDVNGGARGRRDRTTRTLNRINNEDILSGEFYSNITRIPKSNWNNFLKFWDRTKSSVARDVSLFGREWAKHFIMGYQIEPNTLFEIWYNSIDSTFTVHDHRGNNVSQRVKSMTEATKLLIRHIVQSSPSDAEVFRGSTPAARQFSRGLNNALFNDTDHRAAELQRLDAKQSREERAERRLRRKEKQAIAQGAKDRAASASKGVKDFFKNAVNDEAENKKFFGDSTQNQPKEEEFKFKTSSDEDIANFRKKAEEEEAKFRARAKAAKDELDKNFPGAKVNRKGEVEITTGKNDLSGQRAKNFVKKALADNPELRNFSAEDDGAQPTRSGFDKEQMKTISTNAQRKLDQEQEDARRNVVNEGESASENVEVAAGAVDKAVSSGYEGEIRQIRKRAQQSPFTQDALRNATNELIDTYTTTRVDNGFMTSLERVLNGGRSEPIVLPTDQPSIFKRSVAAIRGQRYRSDFVIGFTLNNKIDIEIWYVTEPNPEYSGRTGQSKTVSSYYVFDVTSKTLLRKFVPFYRNAVQIAMAKLGAF